MISIIVCSRKKDISNELRKSIECTIGVEHEIIIVDNSQNSYSIFEAYNIGQDLAKYPYLCFIHEDIIFLKEFVGWGEHLSQYLSQKTTGIIGIAGSCVVSKIPAPWSFFRPAKMINIIQGKRKKTGELVFTKEYFPIGNTNNLLPVILLDGVFLSMRKDVFHDICFDETLSGFHGYDLDISLQSYVAGYRNYVMYDIGVIHYSLGNMDKKYYENLISIFKKYESILPLFDGIGYEYKDSIEKIECKQIRRFCVRMLKVGMPINDVLNHFSYYSKILKLSKFYQYILNLYFRIILFFEFFRR